MRSLALLLVAAPLCAGPQGGSVVDGSATISTAGKVTTIQQSTSKAIITWQKFESTPTETIRFNQPGSSSLTLNRVVGVDPSFLGGALQANGGLFIINPNGIVFGPQSQVNVGSLVASSLNITDADFKNGNFQFLQGDGELSSVINRGGITASEGGTVALIAPIVDNSGTIVAAAGRVILRAALNAGIDAPVPEVPRPVFEAAPRTAQGRNVRMATIGLTPLLEDVVNTQSTVAADKITRLSDGTTFLRGAGGIVVNGGTVNVSKPGGTSGTIALEGDLAVGLGAGSKLLAGTSGGGGSVQLTGAKTIVFSKPSGSSGRALLEANEVRLAAGEGESIIGDADGSVETRGGKTFVDGFKFGRLDAPIRVNTERLEARVFGEVGIISEGDLTIDFLFALNPGIQLTTTGSIFAGVGARTFLSGLPAGVAVQVAGGGTITAGGQIGTVDNTLKIGAGPGGTPTLTAPDGTFSETFIALSGALPPPGAGSSLDTSTPQPRSTYTPPFDPVEVATDTAGAVTVVGGATADLGAATGSGPIVVSSSQSSGSSIGTPDNVLVNSSRTTVKEDGGTSGPNASSDDIVVVKNDDSAGGPTQVADGEDSDEESRQANARRNGRRENAND